MSLASRGRNASARSRSLVVLGIVCVLGSTACRDGVTPPSLNGPARRVASSDVLPDTTLWPDSSIKPGQAIPGDYIVVFKSDVQDAPGLSRQLATQHGARLHFAYTTVLKGFAAHLSDQAVQALQSNPNIERIDQDLVATASGDELSAPWGLDRVDQRGLPLNGKYSYGSSGAGVNVYILDSGIRTTHSEFGGRAFGAFTVIDDGNGTDDCVGHGTHVAGTVGGARYGIAKAATLYAVRVLDCTGNGTWSGIIAGLDWVAKNHISPAVANLSLGADFVAAANEAVANTVASGVTVVVSAGNATADACNYSPASEPTAITVGAANWNDYQSAFSNYGSCLDLYAPGEGITSASSADDSATVMRSGTSMAAPHVTGAAALYLANNPTASPADVAAALVAGATSGALVKLSRTSPNRLLYTAEFTGGTGGGPTASPPVASFTSNCQKGTCTFDGSASHDDVGIVSYAWDFGDGTSSTGANAVENHVYTTKGNYSVTVTLTVRDGAGLTSTVQKTLNIKNNGR